MTLPQILVPAASTAAPVTVAPTLPSTSYLPPVPTSGPTTPGVIIEPIKPVTIPAFIAPATSAPLAFVAPATTAPFIPAASTAPPAPTTAAPAILAVASVTQAPILSFPPRPTVGPVVQVPMNMALMPQLPTVQMAQIVSLDVDCAKESMVVKIKFDRPFGGLIYSKVIEFLIIQ